MLIVTLLSCNDDTAPTSAKSPIFHSLILAPSTAVANTDVTATVEYEYKGKEIYKNDYKLELTELGDNSNTYTYEWTEIDPTQSNPCYTFKAPSKAGKYYVTFKATKIYYSTGGPNGVLYGNANTVSSNLTVTENE